MNRALMCHAMARAWCFFGHTFRGVRVMLSQPNARIHAAATVLVLVLGVWLDINATEWCLVSLAVAMVMGAKALNKEIELAVDLGPVKVAPPTRTGGRG